MNNPIKTIYKFNKEAGLLEQGYYDGRECAFPIEEMLEGFSNNIRLAEQLGILEEPEWSSPKNISRSIISLIQSPNNDSMTDVDRLDKHLDAIIFCFGSIFKLGLTPQQAAQALEIVMYANMQKLHAGKDSHGKQLKPEGFVGPEAELQKLLDKRVPK